MKRPYFRTAKGALTFVQAFCRLCVDAEDARGRAKDYGRISAFQEVDRYVTTELRAMKPKKGKKR